MKKILISMMIIFISFMSAASFSYAAGAQLEATIQITPDKTEVVAGDKVTFTFVTKNIANAESGKIYAIGGKVVYDTEFFELDSTNGITLGDTGLFNSTNAVSEGGTNGTITLKVKDTDKESAIVTFSELTAGDGRFEDMETLGTAVTADQTFTIKIKDDTNPDDTNPDDTNPDDTNPDDTNPDDTNPDDTNPDDTNPDDTNPDDTNPDDTNPDDTNPDDTNPDDTNPDDTNPDDTNPDDKNPDDKDPDEGNSDKGNGNKEEDKKDDTTAGKEIPKAGLNTMLGIAMIVIVVAIVLYRKNREYGDIK